MNQKQQVPCGKCPKCRARRVSGWSHRLQQQLNVSDSAYFITLTYDDSNLQSSPNGNATLVKRDLQLFFKRLRKAHRRNHSRRIRYYAVGEYGGRTYRPHYHIILFNAQPELIACAWTLGLIHYGDQRGVTAASVGYCLKYMAKPSKVGKYVGDDRQKEFALMSKGLGKNYLTPEMIRWHKADLKNRMYINVGDGKKAAMPRYYKEKLYNEIEREHIRVYQLEKMILQQLFEISHMSAAQVLKAKREFEQSRAAAYRRMHMQETNHKL